MAARDAVTRRLFFAIDLDAPCRETVQRLVDSLGRRLDARPSGSKGRIKWVEPENLHITLRFLGATPEARVTELRGVLEPPFANQQFELRFDRLGVFPDRGAPRVIWLGASAGAAKAAKVHQALEERLAQIGEQAERRPFKPHATLGRFRDRNSGAEGRAIRETALEPFDPLLVDHITLYESHLSNRGPVYESLIRVPLKAV